MQKTKNWDAVIIFGVAFLLRLAYHFFLESNYFYFGHPSSDVTYYQEWARDIAWGGNWLGDKTFFGLPLYPYFLAVLERLLLGNEFAIRLLHMAMGSLNCVLVYLIAKRTFSLTVARLAGLLCAANFILIFYDWVMMPVPLLIMLALIAVLALSTPGLLTAPRQWGILGFLLGLGCLGDGKLLIFSFLACAYLIKRDRIPDLRAAGRTVLPLALGVALVLFSVMARNRVVGGDWVFISAQNGLSFYVGNNPDATGVFENPDFIRPTHGGQDEDQQIIAKAFAKKELSPGQVSDFWRKKGLHFIFTQPGDYLKLAGRKFVLFFTDTERAHEIDLILQRDWRLKFDLNPFFILCPMAFAGIWVAWRQRKGNAFADLLILSQLATTLIFFLTSRHRATILPLLIIYQAAFLAWIIEELKAKRWALPVTLALALNIYWLVLKPVPIDAPSFAFITHAKSAPIYEKKEDYTNALEHYFKALEFRPHDTNTLYNLGNTYFKMQDFARAEIFYLKAVATCGYNVDALFNLGYTYEHLGHPRRALELYQQVLIYQPDGFDAHFRIAQIFQEAGLCEQARPHYDAVMKAKPALKDHVLKIRGQCVPKQPAPAP